MKSFVRLHCAVGVAFLLAASLTGCEERVSFRDWAKQTAILKDEMLKQASEQPYRNEQYRALQLYFVRIPEIALELSQDPKRVKQLNETLEKEDLSTFCSAALIAYATWSSIMERCTKNRFFLCSDETRAYPEAVASLRAKLSAELQVRFDQTEACVQSTK